MHSRVIIVDNFYGKPEGVREFALEAHYADISPTDYPGFASKQTIDSATLAQRFEELIGSPLNVDSSRFTWGGFRFITADSGSRPKVHADVAVDWAGMVYLTPDAPMSSGTAFYRHKATGLESPPTDRQARAWGYADAAEFDDKVIRADKADLTKWEQIGHVGPVFNRLVLFRGAEFYHAPLGGCGTDTETARLTHIFFFNVLPTLPAGAYPVAS